MALKIFNARLTEVEMKRLATKASRKGLSKTALLKQWIEQTDVPTVGDVPAFERRNLGNRKLRVAV